ncbi:branched-chain amino acid ABC transporter permease [Leptolyngbya sp. 'hensonii']|uniref:branched-chain amino acid ABC transporter permease n=1 Tax=Leptolyngbya sp. 'hensonii' TaxID=1922337 RepID=UPI00094F9685|nr:branched-chain amino acid ABC transporter permease [Leptolyngbya sp. 'hensonii']OLP18211.1 branched-chain amino acid ABC transporter permease [Leptolyngbya sp. 'hensonii']
MLQMIRVGGGLGVIAALTVLIFGGWSSAVIGWLLGAGAGLIACQGKRVSTLLGGALLGSRVGFTLGGWILVAALLEGFLLRRISGQPAVPLLQPWLAGLLGLGLAGLSGTVMGALQSLGQRIWATRGLLAIGLLLFPLVDRWAATKWTAAVIQMMIFIMLALGLNIVVGFAGLLDLGYAAFFAIGAYTTGFLSSSQLGIQGNFWLVIWASAAVAALFGVILGAPTLRLRGDYLAIVTLGFGEIIPVVFRNLTSIKIYEPISSLVATIANRPELALCLVGCVKPLNLTGGEAGINPIGRPYLPGIGEFQPTNDLPWYYLILVLLVLAYFIIGRLRDSRLGRAWTAIREDELAASAMGINLVKTKLLAFAMGATFSGFAGAFYAAYISAIFPSVFDFSVSVIILCMVILGGLGNMTGVILGGIIIMAADRLYLPQLAQVLKGILTTSVFPGVANPQLRDFLATSVDPIQMRLLLFGLTLVIMMIVRPEGLVPDAVHQAELHQVEAELLPQEVKSV